MGGYTLDHKKNNKVFTLATCSPASPVPTVPVSHELSPPLQPLAGWASLSSSSPPPTSSSGLHYCNQERRPWSQQLPVTQKIPLFLHLPPIQPTTPPTLSVLPPPPPPPPSSTPRWYIPSLSPGAFLLDPGRLRTSSVRGS